MPDEIKHSAPTPQSGSGTSDTPSEQQEHVDSPKPSPSSVDAGDASPASPTTADSDTPESPEPVYGMGLQFRDFVPKQLSNFGIFKVAEYETFESAVLAANRWLLEAPVELIQLETVVLPNIWSKYEEGTTDGSLGTATGSTSHWHQFLRVWYQVVERSNLG